MEQPCHSRAYRANRLAARYSSRASPERHQRAQTVPATKAPTSSAHMITFRPDGYDFLQASKLLGAIRTAPAPPLSGRVRKLPNLRCGEAPILPAAAHPFLARWPKHRRRADTGVPLVAASRQLAGGCLSRLASGQLAATSPLPQTIRRGNLVKLAGWLGAVLVLSLAFTSVQAGSRKADRKLDRVTG